MDNKPDNINTPAHYTFSAIEPADAIRAWGLNFFLGNVVKYVARHAHKGAPLEDLKKARWYLEKEIQSLEIEQKESKTYDALHGLHGQPWKI